MGTIRELAEKSRSYRGYDPNRKVDRDELLELIDCARFAPSSINYQPLKFCPVCDDDRVKGILGATMWAKALKDIKLPHPGKEPSAFIVICLDLSVDEKVQRYQRDVGACAQTMLLAAAERGLGGCMIGSFLADKVSEILSLGDKLLPQLVVAIGKPDETIVLREVDSGESVGYYRDENDVHYVPKRKLADIIIP